MIQKQEHDDKNMMKIGRKSGWKRRDLFGLLN